MTAPISPDPSSPGYWPHQEKGKRDRRVLTAAVRGGGPGALASAVALAQEGFKVRVADIRPEHAVGEGRRNLVAIRPEAMRQLDILGALKYLERDNLVTKNKNFLIINEWNGMKLRPPQVDFRAANYRTPEDRKEHFTTHLVALGDLEDALARAARDLGVVIDHQATINTEPVAGTKRRRAMVVPNDPSQRTLDLGPCDLILCGSGKGDEPLAQELGMDRRIGVKIDLDNLPQVGSREMRFGPQRELESLKFCVLGFHNPALENGTFHMHIRKMNLGPGTPDQPLNEYLFGHQDITSMLLQIPRGMDYENPTVLETYVLSRINHYLGSNYTSIEAFERQNPARWGNPMQPFTVETGSAMTYVYGGNTITIGDFAMFDSPSSGIGAEIATTVDSISVRELARDLRERACGKLGMGPSGKRRSQALTDFNTKRAQASELWSRASRPFYVTAETAEALAKATRAGLARAKRTSVL